MIRLFQIRFLADDTLEYWGFYLMKGATVELKVCSRFEGSKILVVKGERNLNTCGLMNHNINKFGPQYNAEKSQVKITFEQPAEIVNSGEVSVYEQNVKVVDENFIDDEAKLNHGGEDLSDEEEARQKYKQFVSSYLKVDKNEISKSEKSADTDSSYQENPTTHHKRHKGEVHDKHQETADKENENLRHRRSHKHFNNREKVPHRRQTRDTRLDGGINHGGNAGKFSPQNESDSISSFENGLLECYDGNVLVAKSFSPSKNCIDVKSLEHGSHLISTHEVNSDGYYYYIFYSDNDIDSNHIHAVFDIYKPTLLYSNISDTKGCINSTMCKFPIQM